MLTSIDIGKINRNSVLNAKNDLGRIWSSLTGIEGTMSHVPSNFKIISPFEDEKIKRMVEQLDSTHMLKNQIKYWEKEKKKERDRAASILKSITGVQGQIDHLVKAQQEQKETLLKTLSPFPDLNINSFIQDKESLFESSIATHKKMIQLFSNDAIKNIVPDKLRILSENIAIKEDEYRDIISSTLPLEINNDFLQSVAVLESESLDSIDSRLSIVEDLLEDIQVQTKKEKIPAILIILLYLFLHDIVLQVMLGNLSNAIYDYQTKPRIEAYQLTQRELVSTKKEVIKGVQLFIPDPSVRIKYRFVKADVLNVREGKSRSSKIISSLTFGEVVEILRKEKNWCLIKRYNPEKEIYIQGWVFTTYLAQIR